jgi:hypothetical protein
MSYIGNPIVSTDFPVDYASGNGSTTAFTLSVAPASVNAIDVQISGVSQSPQTYSVSGTTLTFTAAPPTGSNNIVVRHKGVAGIPNTPSAASVVTASIADANVTQAKIASNVVGTGPVFSVYENNAQSLSTSAFVKILCNIKEFDTNSAYDNATNYRFQPQIAGYYQINGEISVQGAAVTRLIVMIFKNGLIYKCGFDVTGTPAKGNVTSIVYLNGSSDYVELYGYVTGTSVTTSGSPSDTSAVFFNGCLVRAA